jgi:hypothetical protein
LLVIRYGSHYFALPSDGVRGVLTPTEAGHARIVVWAGASYHKVNLAELLETEPDTTSPNTRTVLYTSTRSRGALWVDEVVGLIDVDPRLCRPLPLHFRREERTWITGLVEVQEHLALILNPEWILGELGEITVSNDRMIGNMATVGTLDNR